MKRFVVREVRGMCVGAGMFVVHDGDQGRQVSHYHFSRDDAEQQARRMNTDAEREMSPHEHAVNDWRLHSSGA